MHPALRTILRRRPRTAARAVGEMIDRGVISASRRASAFKLVDAMMICGSWWQMVGFYMHASDLQSEGRLNWIGDIYTLTENGSPGWVANKGYLGGSSAMQLRTGFVPSVALGPLSQDNAHVGAWSLTDANETTPMVVSEGNSAGRAISLFPRTSGNFAGRVNDSSGSSVIGAVADSLGDFVESRGGASPAQRRGYKDGVLVGSITAASGGLSDGEIYFLGGSTQFSTRRQAISHMGLDLSDAQVAFTKAAKEAYLTEVGAFV